MTLYNLDFCNDYSGHVLRFEFLRRLFEDQKACRNRTGQSVFVVFLTVRDELKASYMQQLMSDGGVDSETRLFVQEAVTPSPNKSANLRSVPHLKAFVFETFRLYCRHEAISTLFFPPLRYVGRTTNSPMVHFTVLCRFRDINGPMPAEVQTAAMFLRRACRRATDSAVLVEPCGDCESDRSDFRPIEEVEAFLR